MTDGPLAGLNDAESKVADSEKNSLTTPRWLFDGYDAEYHFALDAAADHENTLVPGRYCTIDGRYALADGVLVKEGEEDGVATASIWKPEFGTVFCNPPYGTGQIDPFVRAWARARIYNGVTSVFLLPANRTEQEWWQRWVWDNTLSRQRPWVRRIDFIAERLRYGGLRAGAPFPSVVVTFG